jgi:hypothetical protein
LTSDIILIPGETSESLDQVILLFFVIVQILAFGEHLESLGELHAGI